MAYFWVNQGATYSDERAAGLLWAPELTANGAHLNHWDSMLTVAPGDVIFNYANGMLRGYATATSPAVPMPRPYTAGANYQAGQGGRAVFCTYTPLQQGIPFAQVAAQPGLVAQLQAGPNPVLTVNGTVALKYLCAIDPAAGAALMGLLGGQPAPAAAPAPLGPLVVMQLQAARVGQGQFRSNLLAAFGCCAVTGLAKPELLIASHIKPWCKSDNTEKLDPNNGLLLAAGVDAAFDAGLIGFDGAWQLVSAPRLSAADRVALGIPQGAPSLPQQHRNPLRATYLSWHRQFFQL